MEKYDEVVSEADNSHSQNTECSDEIIEEEPVSDKLPVPMGNIEGRCCNE